MTSDVNDLVSPLPVVLLERHGALGLIRLNRPKALNALTTEMVHLMTGALADWAADPSVETVAVVGAGERGLCAGGDVTVFYEDSLQGSSNSEVFWRDEYRLNAMIAAYPKPYVAVMDGIVLGGGVGISAHGSHRVVTERTRFGMPETTIGFIPDVGATWLLSRVPGELGTYLALTGRMIEAGDVVESGLASYYVSSARIDELIELLASKSADQALADLAEVPPLGELRTHVELIDDVFGRDDMQEICQALSAQDDPWSTATRTVLELKSPTSLVLTLRALRSARQMSSLEEALCQEYRIALHLLRTHDLREGIRAQVIEKDRAPLWSPASLESVEATTIEGMFAPVDRELTFD